MSEYRNDHLPADRPAVELLSVWGNPASATAGGSFPVGSQVTVVAKVSRATVTATAVTAGRTAGAARPGQGESGMSGAAPGQ